ncbi:MAG: ATP-grasp domain-containing protein [Ramlibacter sp.]|nr:ATP-grasp domain-containing protein [Ramlibacter sp.]
MPSDDRPHFLAFGGVDHTYRALAELGCTYSLIQDKSLVTAYQQETAVHLVLCDYEDVQLCLELARAMHRRRPLGYVLCLSEYPQRAAAAIAVELGLPTNCEPFAIEHTRDKFRFRDLLDALSVPNVPYRRVNSAQETEAFRAEAGGRIVVKPVSGAGSEGVYFVDAQEDTGRAFAHAQSVGREGVIAEKYVDGDEYSIETISKNGVHELIAATRKTVSGFPHFVELAHVQPFALGPRLGQVQALVFQALDGLRHKTGPAHTEVKVDDKAVHIIESQIRPGGDQLWEITRLTSGMDVARETICCLLGRPAPERVKTHPYVAICFFALAPTALAKEEILADFRPHPNVIRAVIDKIPGHSLSLTHSALRSGYVMAHHDSLDAAHSLARTEAARLVAHAADLEKR